MTATLTPPAPEPRPERDPSASPFPVPSVRIRLHPEIRDRLTAALRREPAQRVEWAESQMVAFVVAPAQEPRP